MLQHYEDEISRQISAHELFVLFFPGLCLFLGFDMQKSHQRDRAHGLD